MTSIFQYARQTAEEEPEEIEPIFRDLKNDKESLIPPLGIAKPELMQSFFENMENEEKIRKHIQEIEAYERETPSETVERETLGHGARALEGFLGGITSFINAMSGDPWNIGKDKLPESEQLREFTKSKTGEYLEPKSEFAKTSQEVSSDIGSMFSVPGLGWLQKILLPIGGQLTKQAIKSTGGGEKAQEYGKLGFMGLSTIAHVGNAPQVAKNAVMQAQNLLPKTRFSAQPIVNAFNKIKNSDWYKSGATPAKTPALKEIQRIEGQIQNGSIDAHMAVQLRKDIQEARKELGGFKLDQPADKKSARFYLDQVDDALLSSMENYGKVNPEWWNAYQRSQEAFRVTQRSQLISDFIERHAKPLKSQMAQTLFHVGGASALLHMPILGVTALPVAGAAKSYQIINRMLRSKVLRDHYIDVLKQASIGNAPMLQKSLTKFDLIADKLEKNQSK